MKTRNYKEVKDLITTDYLTFNHIIESKHIFNQEFIKFRKFFKGLTKKITYVKDTEYNRELEKYVPIKRQVNPYFSSGTTEYYFTLTTENVVDLDIADIQKDFPNLKADYDLLLSLKSNVRSGRRPKDLEKDYEAERLRKAQEEDKATCGICHQYWELVDMNGQKNIIADHGFTLAFGGRNGVCFGARFHSWEKSPESKIQYVKRILKPTLDKVLNEKPTEESVKNIKKKIIDVKLASEEYRNISTSVSLEYYKLERDYGNKISKYIESNFASEEMKKVHNLKERMVYPALFFSGMNIMSDGIKLPRLAEEITLKILVELYENYKQSLINEIEIFETAIKNWTLQPTPRERLKK